MKARLLGKKRQTREDEEEDRVRFKLNIYLKGYRGFEANERGKRRKNT